MKKKVALITSLLIALALIIGACAEVKTPNVVTIICGYSAGGSSDFMCRTLAPALEKALGTTVIVENMPGSSGWISQTEMFTTPDNKADGSRLYLGGTGLATGRYDPDNPREYFYTDCIMMASEVVDYGVVAIRNDETRFTDLESMIEYSKDNLLLVGASGYNLLSDDVNACQQFAYRHGFQYDIVTTDGAKDTEVLFLNGSTDVLFANVGDVLPAHESGQYKILAVLAPERSKLMPDVPTAEELGFGPIYSFSVRGFAYPGNTPQELVDWMSAGLEKAIQDEEVVATLAATGAETVYMGPEDFTEMVKEDLANILQIWGIEEIKE